MVSFGACLEGALWRLSTDNPIDCAPPGKKPSFRQNKKNFVYSTPPQNHITRATYRLKPLLPFKMNFRNIHKSYANAMNENFENSKNLTKPKVNKKVRPKLLKLETSYQ